MLGRYRVFESSEKNVWKYVFECEDAVAEAVLYKYESFDTRTVMCISTMSGCPVGCQFCGTGKKFIRSLTTNEMLYQVNTVILDKGLANINNAKRFQIMFMSMGEPFLNYDNVENAIIELNKLFPRAELLISTVGIDHNNCLARFLDLSKRIDKVGLQFSIHEAYEERRNQLIPYKNKMSIREIRNYGSVWSMVTRRPVYLNYCISSTNDTQDSIEKLKDLFSPVHFNFTFSVICSANENMKQAGFRDLDRLNKVADSFTQDGYNVRVFNPAGQDDIGGGCGQLWYVQKWISEKFDKQG